MKEITPDKYLAQMLEGYEKALPDMQEFIVNTEQQLQGAIVRMEEIKDSIAELQTLLHIAPTVEA